jgi:fructokinase
MPLARRLNAYPTVVGGGFIAYDVLVGAGARYRALGGSAGNVLAILAYLGWKSYPVAHLGHDSAADLIRMEFSALGAVTSFLRSRETTRTPVVYQTLDEGHPRYSFACPICGNNTRLVEPEVVDLASDVADEAPVPQVFFFDRATALNARLASHFRSKGALIVFEPSTKVLDSAFWQCVSLSHVVKYSSDRINGLGCGGAPFLEVCTDGASGLRFRMPDSHDWRQLPSVAAPFVADTSGSGDWCTAGALYRFMRVRRTAQHASVRDVTSALRFGQALAALNCMYEGARAMANSRDAEDLVDIAHQMMNSQDAEENAVGVPVLEAWQEMESPRLTDPLCCKQLAL